MTPSYLPLEGLFCLCCTPVILPAIAPADTHGLAHQNPVLATSYNPCLYPMSYPIFRYNEGTHSMKKMQKCRKAAVALLSFVLMAAPIQPSLACTRAMYVGPNDTIITTRSNDWLGSQKSNLWIYPRGLARDGGEPRVRSPGSRNTAASRLPPGTSRRSTE